MRLMYYGMRNVTLVREIRKDFTDMRFVLNKHTPDMEALSARFNQLETYISQER